MIQTRKRGSVFFVDAFIGSSRLRGSLGTKDKKVAGHLKSRIEVSIAEGAKSAGWVDLKRVLPSETYQRLSSHAGRSVEESATWPNLLSIFRTDCTRRKLKAGSVARYQVTADHFTRFLSGRKLQNLEDITKSVISAFRDQREKEIAANPRTRSGSGLQIDMSCLRLIFKTAVENGMVSVNPVQVEGKAKIQRGTKPFSAEELQRMREVCGPDELLIYLIFRDTGMRGSDVADLRWADVHFPDAEINRYAIKNGKHLQIPLYGELLGALKSAYKGQNLQENVIKLQNKSTDRAQLYRLLRLMMERVGISEGHNHRFRASAAVRWLMRGVSLYEVAQLLGDETRTVEKHYLRFVPEMKSRVRGLLEGKELEAVNV
jgi:integrase